MSTPLLGLYAPADGGDPGTWGSSWNAQGSTYLDNYIAGLTTLSLSASNVTLTAGQARTQRISLTGALLADITIDAGANLWNGIRVISNTTTGSSHTITLSNSGTCVIPQGRRCVVFLDSTNGPQIIGIAGTSTADPIPGNSTTKMPFAMAAAPSGWTQITSYNNYALRLVSGTGAGTGGSTGFTSVFTSRTPAGTNSTSSVTIPRDGWGQAIYSFVSGRIVTTTNNAAFQQATADQTATVSAQTFTGTAMDFAVQYVDLILASRD